MTDARERTFKIKGSFLYCCILFITEVSLYGQFMYYDSKQNMGANCHLLAYKNLRHNI